MALPLGAAPVVPLGASLIMSILSTILIIILGALLLMLTTKLFKLVNIGYLKALFVTTIIGVVFFLIDLVNIFILPMSWVANLLKIIIGVLLTVFLIKAKYEIDWRQTIFMGLSYFVMFIIMILIIAFIIGRFLAPQLILAMGGAAI